MSFRPGAGTTVPLIRGSRTRWDVWPSARNSLPPRSQRFPDVIRYSSKPSNAMPARLIARAAKRGPVALGSSGVTIGQTLPVGWQARGRCEKRQPHTMM